MIQYVIPANSDAIQLSYFNVKKTFLAIQLCKYYHLKKEDQTLF